jgi:Carboxypeptidase regulatory-like domain
MSLIEARADVVPLAGGLKMTRILSFHCMRRIADSFAKSAMGASFLLALMVSPFATSCALAQTASTGALNGTVTDPSGGVIPGAKITLISQSTGARRSIVSGPGGTYLIPFLPPDTYRVEASHADFKVAEYQSIHINVTETATLNIRLEVGSAAQTVIVQGSAALLQTTSSALGRVVGQSTIESLPLVTRNYTQILGLSPGTAGDVNDAADIGRGNTSFGASTEGYSIGGSPTNDNNFQMNGAEVNDLEAETSITGGVPVPNPDSIQEFKVQTGQYDAAYGRDAGANVDVVTKSGTNDFHGDLWEYFRNSVLNANDFFLNASGQPRGVLDQNQFGFTAGGPILKNKLFFFGSYQGTRQRDGLGTGCLTTGILPVGLTNGSSSRTAAALGAEFGGQAGLLGGTVASDGSNISPTALAVLNAQLPDGAFVVPAPQNDTTGETTLSSPCTYSENQFITDVDWLVTANSHLSVKFFFDNSNEPTAYPDNDLGEPAITVGGFPTTSVNDFRDLSVSYTSTFTTHLLNQVTAGFHRLAGGLEQIYPSVGFANTPACAGSVSGPITLASLCVPAPSIDNPFPDIVVAGGFDVGGNGQGVSPDNQNYYDIDDLLTYTRGKHSLEFGGGIDRDQINFAGFHFFGGLLYPTIPDFLLGNVLISIDAPGDFGRAWRVWDGDLFAQDNYQVLPRLTLNVGLRLDREGDIGDDFGRASTFNPALANPNPPATGTLQGFVVASNFSGGAIPPGVTQAGTNTALDNDDQYGWAPRVGFAWQLPGTNRMVLRGGYGIYYTRISGQPFIQQIAAPPWGTIREFVEPSSVDTALPPAPTFPIFTPYSPTTDLTPLLMSPTLRPPVVQQYSMNLQTLLGANWMLEIGYQGTRGLHLLENRSLNQALSASPADPIRGQTTNTLANIPLRVPIEGFDPSAAELIETSGDSWYNALDVSVTKRFSHGLQFLASYTWASALETNPDYTTGGFAGGTLEGNQDSPAASYGPDGFIRPQRLVISYVYALPAPAKAASFERYFLSGWSIAGVTTFQDGDPLTLTDTNETNAFGIDTVADRVQLVSGCTYGDVGTSGSLKSRLSNYFNTACIGVPPVIGSDGLATAFGNSGNGIIRGPAEEDFDVAIIKKTPWGRNEARNIEFRTEFFNAFNTPNFLDPGTNAGTIALSQATGLPTLAANPTFGVIQGTSVNPRIIQFALKLNF